MAKFIIILAFLQFIGAAAASERGDESQLANTLSTTFGVPVRVVPSTYWG